jgi:hypothetical protein
MMYPDSLLEGNQMPNYSHIGMGIHCVQHDFSQELYPNNITAPSSELRLFYWLAKLWKG